MRREVKILFSELISDEMIFDSNRSGLHVVDFVRARTLIDKKIQDVERDLISGAEDWLVAQNLESKRDDFLDYLACNAMWSWILRLDPKIDYLELAFVRKVVSTPNSGSERSIYMIKNSNLSFRTSLSLEVTQDQISVGVDSGRHAALWPACRWMDCWVKLRERQEI